MRILHHRFSCADNSGIKKVIAFQVINTKKKKLEPGDILRVLAKKWKHRRKLKKKQFCLALIISNNN